jgi:O-antigen/teichoic acid export membrane protein
MRKLFYSIVTNNKSLVLADQAVFSGSGFIITLLLVRILSLVDFGMYASILLFNYFVISISNALVIQPLQVILSKIKEDETYLSFAFYSQVIIIGLVILVTALLLQIDLDSLKDLQENAIGIVLFISCFLFYDFFRKVFIAKGTIQKALIIDVITGVLQVGIFSFSFFNHNLNLSQVIFLIGVSYLPAITLSIFFVKPALRSKRNWKTYFQMHLDQGKWLLMAAVLQWWSNNLFVIALGVFLGAAALGAFRLVQSIFGVLNVLLQTFENYALPFASQLFHSSVESSKIYLRNMSLKGAVVFGVVLSLLFLFSEFFIVLAAGESFLEYAFLVKGMAILYFVIFAGYPTRIAIRMMEMNQLFFLGYVISFLFSLLSFNFLLKEWHLWGAIIGLISNQVILISFWQYALLKKQFVLWK